jgi:hypothetical protein
LRILAITGQIRRRQPGRSEVGEELLEQRRHLLGLRCRRSWGCGRVGADAALCGGVCGFVERIERAQNGAAAAIDQIDVGKIPSGIAHVQVLEMSELGGDFETAPYGTVGEALSAGHFDAKSGTQSIRTRTFAALIGPFAIALERGAAELIVTPMVIVELELYGQSAAAWKFAKSFGLK